MQIDNSLIAFSVLAEDFERQQDLSSGIAKLFLPILARHPGEPFNKETFIKEVEEFLDIEMHAYAVDFFAPVLEKQGYLSVVREARGVTEYKICALELKSERLEVGRIQSLLDDFFKFCQSHFVLLGLTFTPSECSEAFMERVVRKESMALLLQQDGALSSVSGGRKTLTIRGQDAGSDDARKFDFLYPSFVLHISENDPGKFEYLLRITNAALLAEVALNIQSPGQGTGDLKGLTIFLDSPLILDALALSGDRLLSRYANELIKQLADKGAGLCIFRHTLDEIGEVLDGTIKKHADGQGFGSLARSFSLSATTLLAAKTTLKNLQPSIERLGVRVFDDRSLLTKKRLELFSEEQELHLAAKFPRKIGTEEKHYRDAKSVASILRLRGQDQISKLWNCKYLFVTRNAEVARKTRRFLQEEPKLANSFPPCVTDRHIAGLLWASFGGGGKELSKLQLLANCSAAVIPNQKLIERVYTFLASVEPEHAAHFKALMREDRCENFVNSVAMGDYQSVTPENANIYFEAAMQSAAERVTHDLTEKFQRELQDEKAQSAALSQKLDHAEAARLTATFEREKFSLDLDNTRQMLNAEKARNTDNVENLASKQIPRALRNLLMWEFGFVCLVAIGVRFAQLQISPDMTEISSNLVVALVSVISATPFLISRETKFKQLFVRNFRDKELHRLLKKLDLDPNDFAFDWASRRATFKS